MRRAVLLLPVLLACLLSGGQANKKMRQVFSWKALDFAYPSQRAREADIRSGDFVPGTPVPIDVDVYDRRNKSAVVFVTIPRFSEGVPVTLGYVTDYVSAEGNPIIAPYPNWDWQRPSDKCEGIISVFRISIDPCGRLWVLDTGKVNEKQICPPQLLMFNLEDNELMTRYVFPADQYTENSLFVTPSVDIRDDNPGPCLHTFVYIADVTGFAIVVYDHTNSKSWRITNKLFYPYPPYGTFNIAGETFDLMDGLLGMAHGPVTPDGDRPLFFHPLASNVEAWVPTSIIRNASIFENQPDAMPRAFKPFAHPRSSQSAAEVIDRNGVMFFGLMAETALACWNSKDYPEYGQNNIENIVVDKEKMQFISGIKVINTPGSPPELWLISVRFQKVMTGSMRTDETNFRIQADYVDELVRGTKCDVVAHSVNSIHRHSRSRDVPGHRFRFSR